MEAYIVAWRVARKSDPFSGISEVERAMLIENMASGVPPSS